MVLFRGYFQVGGGPWGVAFDGENIWAANFSGNSVTVLRAKDGARLNHITVEANPTGIIYDGSSIWVACSASNTVNKITRTAQ